MTADVFLDTNILVYAVAANDPRRDTATDLLARGGTISVQVLNEFASVASRKLGWPWADIRAALASFCVVCPNPRPLALATHSAALTIAERDGIALYDALIVAAAQEAGCSALLTEDLQHGRAFDQLVVRDPFRTAA